MKFKNRKNYIIIAVFLAAAAALTLFFAKMPAEKSTAAQNAETAGNAAVSADVFPQQNDVKTEAAPTEKPTDNTSALPEKSAPERAPEPEDVKTPPAAESPQQATAPPQPENFEKEPENAQNVCSIEVSCATVLDNLSKLKKGKEEIIPPNGIVFSGENIEFSDGESVFDILKRETKKRKISLEFSVTPGTGSVYIEGINNLYEFDCGNLSGWIYKVGGEVLSQSCSEYKLKSGDKIEVLYTCNLGRDLEN